MDELTNTASTRDWLKGRGGIQAAVFSDNRPTVVVSPNKATKTENLGPDVAARQDLVTDRNSTEATRPPYSQ